MDVRIDSLTSQPETRRDSPAIVFVVDDDATMREHLHDLVTTAGWRAELFASAQDFLRRPATPGPSCLVLALCALPIVLVADCSDLATAVRALRAGAVDLLLKPIDESQLVSAIAQALERSRAALVREAELRVLRTCHASLTSREREVMALVTAGRLNKQAAGDLGISEVTVKAHRGKMMRKMNARSLAALVDMAVRLRGAAPFATH